MNDLIDDYDFFYEKVEEDLIPDEVVQDVIEPVRHLDGDVLCNVVLSAINMRVFKGP